MSDGDPGVLEAFASVADAHLSGAYVSVVEQRVAGDGVGLERRVVARGLDLPDFKAWVSQGALSDAQWHNAADVELSARWNATQQVLFVGDASVGTGDLAHVWSGAEFGGHTSATVAVVDTGGQPVAMPGAYVWAPEATADAVRTSVERLASTPHAWAGGLYSLSPSGSVVLDASGSHAAAPLTYEWDLDHDGDFETAAKGPFLEMVPGEVAPGWIGMRVTTAGGAQSVAMTYVAPGALPVVDVSGACTGEVGPGSSHGATVGGALGSAGRGGGEACQPLVAQSPWTDSPDVNGGATHPEVATHVDHEALLLLIADPQLFTQDREQRSLAVAVRKGRSGTRVWAPARLRPQQLVKRERALASLLRSDTTVSV